MVTSHGSYFDTSGLEILLGQFQIKVEDDLLFVHYRKLSPKITRFLQLKPYQPIEIKDITMIATLRLPPNQTLNGSLGDYTQWVHLVCPHWF